jgi:metacaspase-1
MPRATSIHIGVNRPSGRPHDKTLKYSESIAWRMAAVAERAGYDSILVLRGEAATRQAVKEALQREPALMKEGDILFVSFSGHGTWQPDLNGDERTQRDQAWCLSDGLLLDDELVECWRQFEPGVRILVVSDSCYGGGMDRDGDEPPPRVGRSRAPVYRDGGEPVYRDGSGGRSVAPANYDGSCVEPSRDTWGIRASLLLLSATGKDERAREGLFSRHLLELWDDGTFRGSYCDLHRLLQDSVRSFRIITQQPEIRMLGTPDPSFPLETAFHLDRRCGPPGTTRVLATDEIVFRHAHDCK